MILISIIGDFHSSVLPLFYEFKESISKHIVVYDDSLSDSKKYSKIVQSLDTYNSKYNLNIETLKYTLDEDSLESILKLVSYIKSLSLNLNEIYINTTDGLSNIGIIIASRMLDSGVNILAYDMYENSYNIITKNSIITKNIQSKMSIKDHFLLKGLKVISSQDKNFAHRYKKEIMQLFEIYENSFKQIKKDIVYKQKLIQKNYPQAFTVLKKMGLAKNSNHKMITGGLFEYYVYLLVSEMGFDDIEIGIEIEQSFAQNGAIKNEFDILIMKDNHLHMIECKYAKKINLGELVYKYSSLINLIDDDGKIIILTQQHNYNPNLYKNNTDALSNHRRALLNNILIRGSIIKHEKEFIDDVETYFGLKY